MKSAQPERVRALLPFYLGIQRKSSVLPCTYASRSAATVRRSFRRLPTGHSKPISSHRSSSVDEAPLYGSAQNRQLPVRAGVRTLHESHFRRFHRRLYADDGRKAHGISMEYSKFFEPKFPAANESDSKSLPTKYSRTVERTAGVEVAELGERVRRPKRRSGCHAHKD